VKHNYMTPQCQKRLQNEMNQLLKIERPEVTQLVQWAASNGDRSENADYLYGKRRLREIDRRLRFLDQRLSAAVVVDPTTIKSDKVQFGATVKISDDTGIIKTYTIVGVDEVDTESGHISWQSPIGKSLLGKSEGDEITIRVPSGEHTFEIVEIIYRTIETTHK